MKFRVLLLICVLFVLPFASSAQTSRGTVSGVVTDPTGAVIPGATVTLTNVDTGVARTSTTNDEGFYRFDAVDLGNYSVAIAAPNFGTVTKTNVVVAANQTAAVDTQLSPGGAQEIVEVTSDAALLQTEAPVRGGNIESRRIIDLPYAGRNPVALALTLPGVSSNRFGFGVGTFSVNGARGRSNNFLIDGTENNDISVAGQGFQITNPDAVQEVSIQTSNYDAEFGRAGGAVVNTITKSGTNDFHGTLSYLLDATRDDALTSSQSRNPRLSRDPAINPAQDGRGRPFPGTEQYFSGTFGGPIVRNRTFFFGAYQEQRQNSTGTVALTVPSALGRARLRELFQAGTNRNVDTFLARTEGAVANSEFFNIALGRPSGANGVPIAGAADRGNIQFGVFNRSFPQLFKDRQIQFRIDHKITENDQFSARYLFDDQTSPTGSDVSFEGFDAANNNRYQNFLLAYTRVFSSTFTNELRLAYNRLLLDFPVSGSNPLAQTFPQITITDVSRLGVASNLPQGRIANNYVIQDTMTYVRGDHTFRFGLDLLEQRSRQSAPFNSRGTFGFATSSPPANAPAGSTSFTGFANFVDDFGGGSAAAIDFGSPVYFPELFRQAYFFQDRWKATSALTLTLGIRYENFGQPINTLNTAAFTGLFNIDPATRTGPFSQPNDVAKDNNNFAPTLGFAYSPSFTDGMLGRVFGDKRSVIRGGYQIGYDSFFNNIASNAASSSPNVVSTLSQGATVSATQPRGLSGLSQRLPTVARAVDPTDSQTLVDPNLVNPYYQRFSLGVQRELPFSLFLDVAYVGSKGTKLFNNEDRNPVVPAAQRVTPAGYTGPTSSRLDNLQGARLTRSNSGSSSYHSGQFSLSRRFTNSFSFTANYTYSKLIDNASEVFGTAGNNAPQNPAIPIILGGDRNDRAVSLFDRTHRVSITYVYALPFFREQRGFTGRLLGGFEISGVTTFESGAPLNVFNGADADGIGGNFDRPDYNPNGQPGVRAVPAVGVAGRANACGAAAGVLFYTNTDAGGACINPADAQYIGLLAGSGRTGNLGRNTLRTPGTNNFNVNILKRTQITENTRLEFRTEFYNIFNRPQYTQGSVSPFSPGGGSIPATVITSQAGTFLNSNTRFSDGGGRVIRYQLKFIF